MRGELAAQGLTPEDWGGETIFCDVSAKTKEGLDHLLDMILLVAEVEELKANPDAPASGTVIESRLDPGRGPGRDRARAARHAQDGRRARRRRPLGPRARDARLPGQPGQAGASPASRSRSSASTAFPTRASPCARSGTTARPATSPSERAIRLKTEALARRRGATVSLEDVFERAREGQAVELNLVLKADVAGSLEAIQDQIAKLSHAEVAAATCSTPASAGSRSPT